MTLVLFVDQLFYRDGNSYSTDDAFFLFVDSFGIYFEKIIFIGRCVEGKRYYSLDPARYEVIEIPYYDSLYKFWKVLLPIYRFLDKKVSTLKEEIDVMWICMPHPVSLMLTFFCSRAGIPYFLMVRENLAKLVGYRSKGIGKIVSISFVYILDFLFRKFAAKQLIFTVGAEMFRKYSKVSSSVFRVYVSLIGRSNLKHPASVKSRGDMRLLYVGRLDPEKGLFILLDALKLLKNRDKNIILTMVGAGVDEDALKAHADTAGLSNIVRFKGYVAYGPELFETYKCSDVFILPSLSEGFPQVLVEAMAFGVPVIASNIEGLEEVVVHGINGLLVNAGRPSEIADAVEALYDTMLRDKIIKEGYKTAEKLTMESQRDFLYNKIRALLT